MALSAKLLDVNVPGAGGSQGVTGAGFQPKAVIFYHSHSVRTADGAGVHYGLGFGFATASGAGNQSAIWGASEDLVTTSDEDRGSSNADCIRFRDQDSTARLEADFTSMDADGFTLNWTTVTSGTDVKALCLGGSDLTNAKAGTLIKPATTTGNQAVTGVGFQPDLVIFLAAQISSDNSTSTGVAHGLGAAVSSSSRWAASVATVAAQNTSNTGRAQRTDECIISSSSGAPASINTEADFVSMDSDGFTINWEVNQGNNWRIHYLALKGMSVQLGAFLQPAGNGTQDPFTTTFTPKALLLTSFNDAASATGIDHNRISFGVATGASERAAVWAGDNDAAATMVANHSLDSTKVLKMQTPVQSSTPTTQGTADLTSFDSDGVTLTWASNDGTQRQVLYLALGDAPPPPSGFVHSSVVIVA